MAVEILTEAWELPQKSSIHVLFVIFVAGLMRLFMRPEAVSRHLGGGKVRSVIKAKDLLTMAN